MMTTFVDLVHLKDSPIVAMEPFEREMQQDCEKDGRHGRRTRRRLVSRFCANTAVTCLILALMLLVETTRANRIRLDEFTLKIRPADQEMSERTAKEIRDVAETLIEDFLTVHQWGVGVYYNYMGLASVRNITWNPEESYNLVHYKGGLVAFKEESTSTPSKETLQAMIQYVLDPKDGETSELFLALQQIEHFSYIQDIEYETLAREDPPDTLFNPGVEGPVPESSNAASSNNTPLIIGGIAGGSCFLIVVALLSYKHHQRRVFWREDVRREFPGDDLEATNVTKSGLNARDSLNADLSDDAASSRSSRLGRLLAAAVQGNMLTASNRSNGTPPSVSENSSDRDGFSDFDCENTVTVQPTIIPVGQVESFEDQRRHTIIKKDILTTRSNVGSTSDWRNVALASAATKLTSALTDTDHSASALQAQSLSQFSAWSDVSSQPSHDGDQFAPDESWDFDDNVSDAVVPTDPFASPKSGSANAKKHVGT